MLNLTLESESLGKRSLDDENYEETPKIKKTSSSIPLCTLYCSKMREDRKKERKKTQKKSRL